MSFLKNNLISITALALVVALIFSRGEVNVSATSMTPERAFAAQWVQNAVKITFDSNGGGVAPGEQIYTYGLERSLPGICAMQKTGYDFIGWSASKTATTPDWAPGATSLTAFGYADENEATEKTLYAVWGEEKKSGGSGDYVTSKYTGNKVKGKGYIQIFPSSSGSITITVDNLDSFTYTLSSSYSTSVNSHSSSLTGSGSFGTYGSSGSGYWTDRFSYTGTITENSASGSVTAPTPSPFTVQFTKSIQISGNYNSALVYLES